MSNVQNEEIDDFEQQAPIQEEKKKKSVLPIFIISGLLHSIVLLIMLFIIISAAQKEKEDVIVTTELTEVVEEEYKPEEKREVVKSNVEVNVTTEIEAQPMVTNEETTDHNETDNNMEMATSEGTNEGISDSPQVGSGIMGNIGGGGGGGGTFGTRSGGGKKKALLRGGGSAKTESSVDAALRWLMRHQEKDGHWDGAKYGDTNSEHSCSDQGQSGLALLAFLAAGHTPKIGKYKNTVKVGIEWVMSQQNPDGSFGPRHRDHSIYENCICTLTLAEAFGMYPDPKIKAAAQKAVDYLANVDPGKVHYNMNKDKVPLSMSVLGWMMMAFKSAKIAGLKIPEETFANYKARVDEMTVKDQSGNPQKTNYMVAGDRKSGDFCMTAVGMLVYEYCGVKRDELSLMADGLLKDLPAAGGDFDIYRYYYATLAMFQYGGDKWKTWNKALMETLVGTQRKGGPMDGTLQDTDGSWDYDKDKWGPKSGRVYQTAMSAFCLEVYYRYESVVH